MTRKILQNRTIRALAALAIALGLLLPTSGIAVASEPPQLTATYTIDGDFDLGEIVNVNHNAPDNNQLQLTSIPNVNVFVWVAVSSKGTITKIDGNTGAVLGEYRTAPLGRSGNPSRTSLDSHGNVWATNSDEVSIVPANAIGPVLPPVARPMGSVIKIGLRENGQCVDRNGNGVIDTSTGLDDIRSWSNEGGANDYGGVSTAEDECILQYVRINATGARHVSVNADDNVWASGTGYRNFDLINGATGALISQASTVSAGGFGGLIDGNGILWSSRPLLRWDATTAAFTGTNGDPEGNSIGPFETGSNWASQSDPDSYGLCMNPNNGEIWNTQLTGNVINRYAPDGTWIGGYQHGNDAGQGCVVDRNNHVWVAHSLDSNTVGHLDADGNLLGVVPVGQGPTAVAVDTNGKIWSTGFYSQTVSRIDPSLNGGIGAIDLTTVNLGGNLYNYSDMTTSTSTPPSNTGTWAVNYDSGVAGAYWGTITWNDEPQGATPGNSTLTVQARSSEDGVTWGPFEAVTYGADINVANGRYLQVHVTFTRSTTTDADGDGIGDSPIMSDLTVSAEIPEEEEEDLEVSFDIKPGSCPNPLQIKENGVVPMAILGTANFDITQIDVSTIRIEGIKPGRTSIEDVATPYLGGISDIPKKDECSSAKKDKFKDLTMKFDAQELLKALESAYGPLTEEPAVLSAHEPQTYGRVLVVTMTASLLDGTNIIGEDVVWIHGKKITTEVSINQSSKVK